MSDEPTSNTDEFPAGEPEIGELPQNVHDELEQKRARRYRNNTFAIVAAIMAIAAVTAVSLSYGNKSAHVADEPVAVTPALDTATPGDEASAPADEITDTGESYVDSVIAAQLNGPPFTLQDFKDVSDKFVAKESEARPDGKAENCTGLSAMKRKNYAVAIESFEQAVKANPSNAEFVANLAAARKKVGDRTAARATIVSSLKTNPLRADHWGTLGVIYAREDEPDKAVACFQIRNTISPRDTITYLKSLRRHEDIKVRNAASEASKKIRAK
jgi:tetratricopeptide (TPR) repeat protein